jgi:broad specificity phosphatase PhoE
LVREIVNLKRSTMTTRLTLVSHAATPALRAAAFPLDEGIDEKGKRDAAELAGSWPPFIAIWTSPARRAVETAAALGLDATVEPLLEDIDLGRWAGRTFSDVEAAEAEGLAQWLSDPEAIPHGGESIQQLIARVGTWLGVASHCKGRIAAVTHSAVIRAAIVCAIESGPAAFWRIDIAPLCIVELNYNGRRWALRAIGS